MRREATLRREVEESRIEDAFFATRGFLFVAEALFEDETRAEVPVRLAFFIEGRPGRRVVSLAMLELIMCDSSICKP